jgi:hypothetical protein
MYIEVTVEPSFSCQFQDGKAHFCSPNVSKMAQEFHKRRKNVHRGGPRASLKNLKWRKFAQSGHPAAVVGCCDLRGPMAGRAARKAYLGPKARVDPFRHF